jgi:hypothetical protein
MLKCKSQVKTSVSLQAQMCVSHQFSTSRRSWRTLGHHGMGMVQLMHCEAVHSIPPSISHPSQPHLEETL